MNGFKNSYILTPSGLKKLDLLFENKKIVKIGNDVNKLGMELDENFFVLPGFIDQHIHGAGGSDAMDGTVNDLKIIADALASEGTTTFLATTMTQSIENIDKALRAINQYITEDHYSGAKILGVHLEGPFISKDFVGAQPIEYVANPDVELFKHYQHISGNNIRLVSMAAEVNGAEDLIKYLISQKIVASIGHSASNYEDVKNAISWGVTNITHTYNAMKGIHHREIGTVGAAFMFDSLNCEMICDGIHLSIPAMKLLLKNKPANKVTLITDAMRAKNLPDGKSELGGQVVIVKNGEARLTNGALAGSVLKMNIAIKNAMHLLDLPLEKAVALATINPATNLGIDNDYGSIEVGKYANFVVVNRDMEVQMTIRDGHIVYKK